MKKIKSPLRYPGGKEKVVNNILNHVPNYKEYREPFLGGGSLYLRLKELKEDKIYWINDLFYELYKFWFELQNNHIDLISKIKNIKDTIIDGRELFYNIKNNIVDENNIASYFYFMNRSSYSGLTYSGGYSKSAFESRFTINKINELEKIYQLLIGTKITNLDYSELLYSEGDRVFIFIDPPYYGNKKSALYGKDGKLHIEFDHQRLANELKECDHLWLMTIDDHEYIRNLFNYANIEEFNINYSLKNPKKINELFIKNF